MLLQTPRMTTFSGIATTVARSALSGAEPRFFHTHAPSGFYRRALIEKAGLRLDSRLRAAFEDAAFAAEYMLGIDDPVIGFVPDAVYKYRKRPDSVIGTMWSKPERYTTVVEHGYLRLLRLRSHPPLWLQNLVLYDLWWFFHEYERPDSANRTMGRDVADAFLAHLDAVLELIDERLIYGYCLHPLPLHRRTALAARKSGRLCVKKRVSSGTTSTARRIRLSYFALPGEDRELSEVVTVDGMVQGRSRPRAARSSTTARRSSWSTSCSSTPSGR